MSTRTPSDRPSSFDKMLDDTRAQFETLARRGGAEHRADRPAAHDAPTATDLKSSSESSSVATVAAPAGPKRPPAAGHVWSPAQPFDATASETGRTLASRFGDRWTCDVVEARRDGTDIVVWVRLAVAEKDHDKTRRGRAPLTQPGNSGRVVGRIGDAPFSLDTPDVPSLEYTGDAEQAAFEAAAANALVACAKGL